MSGSALYYISGGARAGDCWGKRIFHPAFTSLSTCSAEAAPSGQPAIANLRFAHLRLLASLITRNRKSKICSFEVAHSVRNPITQDLITNCIQ